MTKVKAYQASDGTTYAKLADAQKAELALILDGNDNAEIVEKLVANAEKVAAILGVKERKTRAKESKPRARKSLGKTLAEANNAMMKELEHD